MISIQRANAGQKTTAHLLPCHIHYDGKDHDVQRFFKVKDDADNDGRARKTAYFRGRKLEGALVSLPDGYEGHVVDGFEDICANMRYSDGADNEDQPLPTKKCNSSATFQDLVVWGHDALPDAASDPWLKGVNEWIDLARLIHTAPIPQNPCPK